MATITRIRNALDRNPWRITAAALVCFVTGAVLSHCLEPGVDVKKVTLAGDTPSLKFNPAGTGPHPVALLAHGYPNR